MGGEVVARRYAKALFLTTADSGERDRARQALDQLAAAMAPPDGPRRIILNPFYAKPQREAALQKVIDAIAGVSAVPPSVVRFSRLLLRKNRFDLIGRAATAFSQLIDQESGRLAVAVSAARPLDDQARQALQRQLEQALQRPVGLTVQVDPSLLGGLRLQSGSRLIDGTIRGSLERVRRLAMEEQG